MAGKEAIAEACLALLADGDSVFLDSGTTVEALARKLAGQANTLRLSVLTSSLGVATALAEVPTIDCVLLGGQLRRVDGSVVGDLALENLQRFTFSAAFLGVSGFSELGISVGSLAEAALKAAVIERARRVVLPVDHRKVGATDFARVCELDSGRRRRHGRGLARRAGPLRRVTTSSSSPPSAHWTEKLSRVKRDYLSIDA